MAQDNLFKRYLEAGAAFTQLTQQRAEAIVRDLVKAGEVQAEQAQTVANVLLDRSRKNTDRLVSQVQREVRDQVSNLGLATKADIARIERHIASLKGAPATAPSNSASGPARTPAAPKPTKKAEKTTAKKATSKKARKATAKKATAGKSSSKKAAGKKAASRS